MYASGQVTLAVEDLNFADAISIYPNPVMDNFKINSIAKKVDIYDISGRLVKTFKGDFNETYSFDIKNLNRAVYIVRITSENGSLTKKIIKN